MSKLVNSETKADTQNLQEIKKSSIGQQIKKLV